MCFTSLVGREGPLPAVPQRLSQCGKERTEKEKETRAAAPPYESHLRPPRPPLPRLARYYSGHVLFSFIFHGAEYARDSGEGGRREEGRRPVWQGYSVVALHCNTGARWTMGKRGSGLLQGLVKSMCRLHFRTLENSIGWPHREPDASSL